MHNSYDIICDAERMLPKKAYLELLDQPEKIIVCTLKEEIIKINSKRNGSSIDTKFELSGNINQIINVKKKVNTGDKKNNITLELEV